MSESLREIYNAASEGSGEPEIMQMPCENCGGIVTFLRQADTTVSAWCDGCDSPRVTLETHNPRLLGIVSSD